MRTPEEEGRTDPRPQPVALRVLLLDNYDSFTFNLAQALGALGAEVEVLRSDARSVEELLHVAADGIVLSPGPGRPADSGACPALLKVLLAPRREIASPPILGVCLGHQAMAEVCGAAVVRAQRPIHGQVWEVEPTPAAARDPLWRGIRWPLLATRYHSLIVDPSTVPRDLIVTARTPEGEIMAQRHRRLPWWGVQFHPESIGCAQGPLLLRNFLHECALRRAPDRTGHTVQPQPEG
jgi:anthranilate synthase/aminodeoxychorismate synthase-like glutamine amidotransferase